MEYKKHYVFNIDVFYELFQNMADVKTREVIVS